MIRCPMAIKFGNTLHTRCWLKVGHADSHRAKGLSEFPYQRIEWWPGDGREYTTERRDEFAWEEE